MRIKKVISLCLLKDVKTWSVSSRRIIENIDSDIYEVIVPDQDVDAFKAISPARYDVIKESLYSEKFISTLDEKFSGNNSWRRGWYLQQLIKLSALQEAKPEEIYLIWDADTVPLKPLSFCKGDKIGHYKSHEHHQPYFDFISLALGLVKKVDYSFIAQCIAIKGQWFQSFRDYIEERNHDSWIDVLIQKIDFDETSGFSEYETLGTFLTYFYSDELFSFNRPWMRKGSLVVGSIDSLNKWYLKLLLLPFDFVTFETWNRSSAKTNVR